MPSSLRNSIHRRNHKERSQLSHRTRLGILEKHKDYVQRARDYHSKQDRLIRLKQKAAERNKDEFYFSMTREKTLGGVHVKDRGNEALPVDIVKVLKTQDENYVRTMRASGQKKIDKIKSQLTALADLVGPLSDDKDEELDEGDLKILRDAGIISSSRKWKSKKGPKHIVFAESNDEAKQYVNKKRLSNGVDKEDIHQKQLGTLDLGWQTAEDKKRGTKRRKSEDVEISCQIDEVKQRELATQHRHRLLKELSARLARDTQLRYAQRELEMQRLLMGKGGRRKLRGVERVGGDDNEKEDEDEVDARKGRRQKGGRQVVDEKVWRPRVYKWKIERKR